MAQLEGNNWQFEYLGVGDIAYSGIPLVFKDCLGKSPLTPYYSLSWSQPQFLSNVEFPQYLYYLVCMDYTFFIGMYTANACWKQMNIPNSGFSSNLSKLFCEWRGPSPAPGERRCLPEVPLNNLCGFEQRNGGGGGKSWIGLWGERVQWRDR